MLAQASDMRSEGNLPDKIIDGKLTPHLNKAVIEIKKILTAEKYTEIEALDSNDEDRKSCVIAEANLALSYAVTSLNIETTGTGIVRTKGFDANRSDLLSQREVESLREYYRNIAMELLEPFIPQAASTEDTPADTVKGSDYRMFAL
jgi:hypothetical protein